MNLNSVYIRQVLNVVIANLVNFVCSVLITLILPKLISIKDYGEWQYFLLLFTYVEVCQFGFANGVYLRYGGCSFEEMDLGLLKKQFMIVFLFILTGVGVILFYTHQVLSISILGFVLCIPIMTWRFFVDYLLQASGHTDEYAKILLFDKLLFSLFLLFHYLYFDVFHVNDIINSFIYSKILISIYCCIYLKEFLQAGIRKISVWAALQELMNNISVGSKLLFATVCSLLIVGSIRFVIVDIFDKSIYGKVAIVLSVCSFIMVFVNAVSIVMFPSLRNLLNRGVSIRKYYQAAYVLFNLLMLFLLLSAYPLLFIFKYWLIQYSESGVFIFILLPVILFDSNWSIFSVTLLKVYRKESLILKITIVSLLFSLFLITFLINFQDILLVEYFISLIPLVLLIRFIYAEQYVDKLLTVNTRQINIFVVLTVFLFIILNNYLNLFMAGSLYVTYLFFVCYRYRKKIFNSYRILRNIK